MDDSLSELKQAISQIMTSQDDILTSSKLDRVSVKDLRAVKQKITKIQKTFNNALQLPEFEISSIHHLSCTGGTLITKCIASMNNVLVLNELDPLSQMPYAEDKPHFTPTDIASLLHQSGLKNNQELLIQMFQNDIVSIAKSQDLMGLKIVLRDHSHSHFLHGDSVHDRPTVLEIVQNTIKTRSLITVRNPIDSYASMESNNWHKFFNPSTFTEYCRRYNLFIERYAGIDIIKYEDFTQSPKKMMKQICTILNLNYQDDFEKTFHSHTLSGDSGRGGDKIIHRAGLSETLDLKDLKSYKNDPEFLKLNQKLNYEI